MGFVGWRSRQGRHGRGYMCASAESIWRDECVREQKSLSGRPRSTQDAARSSGAHASISMPLMRCCTAMYPILVASTHCIETVLRQYGFITDYEERRASRNNKTKTHVGAGQWQCSASRRGRRSSVQGAVPPVRGAESWHVGALSSPETRMPPRPGSPQGRAILVGVQATS